MLTDPQDARTGSIVLDLYDVPADAAAVIVPGGPAVTLTTTVAAQNAGRLSVATSRRLGTGKARARPAPSAPT